jgi:hypothetical protein
MWLEVVTYKQDKCYSWVLVRVWFYNIKKWSLSSHEHSSISKGHDMKYAGVEVQISVLPIIYFKN